MELGINAVELLPVFEFDELEFKRFPNPRDHMVCFTSTILECFGSEKSYWIILSYMCAFKC